MKSFLVSMLLVFFVGCVACTMKPERMIDKNGVSMEPDECYDYRVCMYYVSMGKFMSDCKKEFDQCQKSRRYEKCKDDNYRWKSQTEQNCWNLKD